MLPQLHWGHSGAFSSHVSLFDTCIVFPQEQCGSYTFIPYVVSPQGKVFACDATMMTGIKELMQPSFQLEPLLTPLVERLVHLLNNVHLQSRSGINCRALFTTVCFAKKHYHLRLHMHVLMLLLTASSVVDDLLKIVKLWTVMTPPLFVLTVSTSGSQSGMRSVWHGSGSAAKLLVKSWVASRNAWTV